MPESSRFNRIKSICLLEQQSSTQSSTTRKPSAFQRTQGKLQGKLKSITKILSISLFLIAPRRQNSTIIINYVIHFKIHQFLKARRSSFGSNMSVNFPTLKEMSFFNSKQSLPRDQEVQQDHVMENKSPNQEKLFSRMNPSVIRKLSQSVVIHRKSALKLPKSSFQRQQSYHKINRSAKKFLISRQSSMKYFPDEVSQKNYGDEESSEEEPQNIFQVCFKSLTCRELKQVQAREKEAFKQKKARTFKFSYFKRLKLKEEKPPFKVQPSLLLSYAKQVHILKYDRFHGMKFHNFLSQEVINLEMKKAVEEKRKIMEKLEFMLYGEIQRQIPWKPNHKMQPITRNMGTGLFPSFLYKGVYKEPGNVAAAMLRPLFEPKIPFRLHTKGLKPTDLNQEFGQMKNLSLNY